MRKIEKNRLRVMLILGFILGIICGVLMTLITKIT
jgi:uncharacterized membrane protein YoaK (UPF0700 family)